MGYVRYLYGMRYGRPVRPSEIPLPMRKLHDPHAPSLGNIINDSGLMPNGVEN